MGAAVIKSIKWVVLNLCVIGGIYGLVAASNGNDVKPLMISVLCFGAVYMMFKLWSELPGKLMIASVVIVAGLAVFAQPQFVPQWLYLYADINIVKLGFYQTWAGLVASIGFLIMSVVFWKFDD